MDKQKFDFSQTEEIKTILYKGSVVQVKPFIGIGDETFLVNLYIGNYFFPREELLTVTATKYDYLGAEWALSYAIVDMLTNIEIDEKEFGLFLKSGLWEEIIEKITNYKEFRAHLDRIVSDIKEEKQLEKSLGYVVENLADRIFDFVVYLRNNIQPEDMANTAKDLIKAIEKSSIGDILIESQKEKRAKKAK